MVSGLDYNDRLCVFLATPFPPPHGGITNWSRIVYSALREDMRIDCKIVDISLKAEAADRGFSSNLRGLLRILASAKKVMSDCPKDGKCVLHICTSGGKGFLRDLLLIKLAHRCSIPAVVHFHFGRIPDLLTGVSFEKKLLLSVIKHADGVISMDRRTYIALKACSQVGRLWLIPNPIDLRNSDCLKCKKKKQIVFVGHVNKMKGVLDLLHAWKSSASRGSGAKLKIIGPIQADLAQEVKSWMGMDCVEFTGPMSHDDVLVEIASSKCLVLPSYTEGFPNVVLEAFAMGTPVVASDVGALPEMLSDDTGIIVKPGDVNGIKSAIDDLYFDCDRVERIVASGKSKVSNEYSIRKVEEGLFDCWSNLTLKR